MATGQDVRFAIRVFRAHPGITLTALLSLALGMGFNSTMFSLVDGMFLRPLPVRDPAGMIWVGSSTADGRSAPLGWMDYRDIAKLSAFEGVAVQNRRGALLNGEAEDELVLLTVVSDNYFPLLGVRAAHGRLFREDLDAGLTSEPAVAISDSLWRRRFGADPSITGRTIRMNNRAFTVVGILPPEFRGLIRGVRNDIWVPASTWRAMGGNREFQNRGPGQFEAIGRLRAGVSLAQARAELDLLTAGFQREYAQAWRARRLTAETNQARESGRGTVTAMLLGFVALLVVIACGNVAMLLLALAETRRREIGVRLALGASRGRLVRMLLTEGALLALAGGVAALVFTRWMIPLLPVLMPPGPDFIRFDIRLDLRVVVVTLVTCAATVLLFGLAPALDAARTDLNTAIKSGGWAVRRRFSGRSLLVATQAALGVVLLTAAGLLARSFLHTTEKRLGFDTDRAIALVELSLQRGGAESLLERLKALPGVKRAAYCRRVPMAGSGGGAVVDVTIPGREVSPGQPVLRVRYNQVSPDYFAVTGTRVLGGAAFSLADEGGARVAMVSQTMAAMFWPGRDPVGEWIQVAGRPTRITGVAEDAVIRGVHEPPEPFLYFPFGQMPSSDTAFLMETAGEHGPILDAAKREARAAGAAVLGTNSLRQHIRDAMYFDWLPAVLAASVGLLGMAMAAAGLFGVVTQNVNRQTRELGVRMALGASGPDNVGLVLKHGLMLAGAGAAAGVGLALGAGRLMSGMLHGVSPYDPLTLALSVAAVLAVALAACLYPAWRASRLDPAEVLRAE